MKKYLLAAALVLASTSAMADRTVSGNSDNGYETKDKGKACEKAKDSAAGHRGPYEEVDSYSKCDCDKNEKGYWSCSVDAKLEKKH